MAKDKINWTDQQRQAIIARGSDVLVTASAGTGKTQVLSGRCVDLLADKPSCSDVRNMLILTFTEMAAEQMRSRIAEHLTDEFHRTKASHLRRQLVMLQGADISTIHSFCKRLITQYFHELGLDPAFSIIDADEARLLKADVLEKAVDFCWRQGQAEDLEQLLRRRNVRPAGGFLARVIELSDFLDGIVSRGKWCERAVLLANAADPAASDLAQKQKDIIADKLRAIIDRLRNAQQLCRQEAPDGDWAGKLEETHVVPVARCLNFLESGDWDACFGGIRDFVKPTTRTPKDVPEILAGLLQTRAKTAIDKFKELSNMAVMSPDYVEKVGRPVGSQTHVLVELVEKFGELYSRAKLSLNCLDFADLEHYAVKLLTQEGPDGDLVPSATALALRGKYKYIFVDEYQDINPVQQAILNALSSGDNLFVVGDIKQSIYAWRGAEPRIFLERLKAPPEAAGGLRVDLNTNFRSEKGILDFVNRLFSRIMTASFANIDYDESAELRPGPTEESEPQENAAGGPLVEFHILDEKAKDDADGTEEQDDTEDQTSADIVTSRRRQAAMIARRIRKMVGAETGRAEFQICDKERKCKRDVDYNDIVILMRSPVGAAGDYIEVLRLAGVPVSCEATAGYFEATEITDMLCLLKVLDNPQRDIELAAVLRSPFFGVTDTELAKIRMHARSEHKPTGFYDRLLEYSKSGADVELASKLARILARIDHWRTDARQGSIADMVWRIYRSTNYLSFVSALPSGQARRANLLKLHDRAIQFEGFVAAAGVPSLRRFVEFIEKLRETGQDWAPAEPAASAGRAVRILSVHKSKGLEFPVVFLPELQTKFNMRDIYADCLADAEDTLGLQIIDRESNSRLRSLAHEIIAEKKHAISLAEEMRILYVATTRAKDRLVLTAAQKSKTCAAAVTGGFYLRGKPLPDWLLGACKNPLDWILQGFSDQKPLHEALETGLADQCRDDNLFTFTFHNQAELAELSQFVTNLKRAKSKPRKEQRTKPGQRKPIINNQLSIINKSLSWRYSFADAPLLPAKTSVSELTHRSDEYVRPDYSKHPDRRPACLQSDRAGRIDPRLTGSAVHLLIATLDLTGPVTKEAIERTRQNLLSRGAVTPTAAEQIDVDSILAFFETDIGRLALDPANKVRREWPFTFALPASEWHTPSEEQWTKDDGRQTTDDRRQRGENRALSVSDGTTSDIRYPTSDIRDTTGGSPKRIAPPEPAEGLGMADNASRLPLGGFTLHASRDTIIIQGIIDLLIQTPHGLVVIDFKTDNISAAEAPRRAKLYRTQLETYAKAAAIILNAESTTKHLYFLTAACRVEVP